MNIFNCSSLIIQCGVNMSMNFTFEEKIRLIFRLRKNNLKNSLIRSCIVYSVYFTFYTIMTHVGVWGDLEMIRFFGIFGIGFFVGGFSFFAGYYVRPPRDMIITVAFLILAPAAYMMYGIDPFGILPRGTRTLIFVVIMIAVISPFLVADCLRGRLLRAGKLDDISFTSILDTHEWEVQQVEFDKVFQFLQMMITRQVDLIWIAKFLHIDQTVLLKRFITQNQHEFGFHIEKSGSLVSIEAPTVEQLIHILQTEYQLWIPPDKKEQFTPVNGDSGLDTHNGNGSNIDPLHSLLKYVRSIGTEDTRFNVKDLASFLGSTMEVIEDIAYQVPYLEIVGDDLVISSIPINAIRQVNEDPRERNRFIQDLDAEFSSWKKMEKKRIGKRRR